MGEATKKLIDKNKATIVKPKDSKLSKLFASKVKPLSNDEYNNMRLKAYPTVR